jgi:glycosyltransferase involved in cell wall biosynthesis
MRHVDAWVGISDAFRERVVAEGIPESHFHRIYGSVDVERYRPLPAAERGPLRRRLGIPEDARVAVSVGSIIPRKGMDRVMAAWEKARPQAGRDLLLLVGPTEPNEGIPADLLPFVAELRARAEAPSLAGTVRFTGGVDDVHAWLAAADAFVFLSRQEGMGYVIVEAMACGLPCLVSPLDGIGRELVDEGVTGHVAADPDDAAAIGARLRAWLDDLPGLVPLGCQARRMAESRFSMAARAEALAALYRELVAGTGQSG